MIYLTVFHSITRGFYVIFLVFTSYIYKPKDTLSKPKLYPKYVLLV